MHFYLQTNLVMRTKILIAVIFLTTLACTRDEADPPRNTIFKMGFKTDLSSTGPLDNSAFVLKVNDTLPPLLLTAHHAVAGIGNNQYLKWNELEEKQKDARAWSMQDSAVNFKVGKNLPVRNAETSKLDIAAFYIPTENVSYLRPAKRAVQVGDTTYLFSKITYQGKTSLLNRGVVIYVTDSIMVYELTDFNMARIMSGTSGSCVVNKEGEVVANSYAGFTIPNEQVKEELAILFPLLNKLETKNGKTYGAGVPIALIEKRLVQAFQDQ
jgi:hypothetical protein